MSNPLHENRKPSPEREAFETARVQARPEPIYSLFTKEKPTTTAQISTSGWHELDPDTDMPGYSFFTFAVGAIFWNGLIWGGIIAKQIHRFFEPSAQTSSDQPQVVNDLFSIGCISIGAFFWGFFALIGVWLIFLAIGYGIRGMMLLRTELPKVEVSVIKFAPGTTFRLKIGPISRGGLSRLSARLVCEESFTFEDHEGGNISTREIMVSELCHSNSLPMETAGSIPQTAMPSFYIENPGFDSACLKWFLTVNGRIFWVIPYSLRYPITIHSVNA